MPTRNLVVLVSEKLVYVLVCVYTCVCIEAYCIMRTGAWTNIRHCMGPTRTVLANRMPISPLDEGVDVYSVDPFAMLKRHL